MLNKFVHYIGYCILFWEENAIILEWNWNWTESAWSFFIHIHTKVPVKIHHTAAHNSVPSLTEGEDSWKHIRNKAQKRSLDWIRHQSWSPHEQMSQHSLAYWDGALQKDQLKKVPVPIMRLYTRTCILVSLWNGSNSHCWPLSNSLHLPMWLGQCHNGGSPLLAMWTLTREQP